MSKGFINTVKIYSLFFCGFFFILGPVAVVNYYQDPYAVFAKVVDKNTYISKDFRYSFPNIARKMAFKTAIVGTSDSLPYHQKNVTRLFDKPSFNFALEGATNYEQSLLVEVILNSKPNAVIIWQINWLSLLWKPEFSRISSSFPTYMYKENDLLVYFKTLINPFYAYKSLINRKNLLIKTSDLESWDSTSERDNFLSEFEKRMETFFNFVKHNKNIGKFDGQGLQRQFSVYVEDVVKKNPQSKFIIVLPPFSDRFLKAIKKENPSLFRQYTLFNSKINQLEKNFLNVNLVDFQKKCDFPNRDEIYKDLFHFKNKYAEFFMGSILSVLDEKIKVKQCP